VNAEFTDLKDGEEWKISTWMIKFKPDRANGHQRWMAEKYLGGYVQVKEQKDKDFMHFLNWFSNAIRTWFPARTSSRRSRKRHVYLPWLRKLPGLIING
jgi:hypothetical protein